MRILPTTNPVGGQLPKQAAANSTPSNSGNLPQDSSSLSPEASLEESGEVPNLGALADSFAAPGQRELRNPSAELQQDCVNILGSLGKEIPADVDTRKTLLASPVAQGSEALKVDKVTSVARSDRGQQLLDQLMRSSATARAEYGGQLPPKVEKLLQTTLAALSEVGIEPGKVGPAAGERPISDGQPRAA